ncbi:hypothetical protein GCM10020227_52770 [Streptomyces flavovirens]
MPASETIPSTCPRSAVPRSGGREMAWQGAQGAVGEEHTEDRRAERAADLAQGAAGGTRGGGEAGRQAVHGDVVMGGRGQGDAYAEYADDRGGGGDTGGRVEGGDEEGADAACDEADDQDEAGGGADHEASDQRAEDDGAAVEGDEAWSRMSPLLSGPSVRPRPGEDVHRAMAWIRCLRSVLTWVSRARVEGIRAAVPKPVRA